MVAKKPKVVLKITVKDKMESDIYYDASEDTTLADIVIFYYQLRMFIADYERKLLESRKEFFDFYCEWQNDTKR